MSGISICMDDMLIPREQRRRVPRDQVDRPNVETVIEQYQEGLIHRRRARNKDFVDIWADAVGDRVAKDLHRGDIDIGRRASQGTEGKSKLTASFNPNSHDGRLRRSWSNQQIRQLAGMRGLNAKALGARSHRRRPITRNSPKASRFSSTSRSTHGARKGLADTRAAKTREHPISLNNREASRKFAVMGVR